MLTKFLFANALFELVVFGMLLMLETCRMVLFVIVPEKIVEWLEEERMNSTDVSKSENQAVSPNQAFEKIRNELKITVENETTLYLFSLTEGTLFLLAAVFMAYATKNVTEPAIRKRRILVNISNFFVAIFLVVICFRSQTLDDKGPLYKLNAKDWAILIYKSVMYMIVAFYSNYIKKLQKEISIQNISISYKKTMNDLN